MSSLLEQYLTQESEKTSHKREADEFTDLSADFKLPPERKFNLQYCKIYRARLATQYSQFPFQKLGVTPVQILNVPQGSPCTVIGTIYKEMKGKPNVLQRLASGKSREKCLTVFYSKVDLTYLEDDTGRMKLGFKEGFSPDELCTGVVVAIDGCFLDEAFQISKIYYPEIQFNDRVFNKTDRILLLTSGLTRCNNFELLKNLAQGTNLATRSLATQLSRVMVCGMLPVNFNGNASSEIINFDADLEGIASRMAVNLIPGESDISTAFFPRLPMHKSFFPSSFKYQNFRSESNPFRCIIDGGEVVVICGSTLKDSMKHYNVTTELEAAKNLLKFGHLMPTGPDTLEVYPYETRDPFCLTKFPNLLIFGGCKEFGFEKMNNLTIVCVPEIEDGFVGFEIGTGECFLIET